MDQRTSRYFEYKTVETNLRRTYHSASCRTLFVVYFDLSRDRDYYQAEADTAIQMYAPGRLSTRCLCRRQSKKLDFRDNE